VTAPALSVILVTPDGYKDIEVTVRHIRAQTIARDLELLIVAPDASRVDVSETLRAELHGVRIVEFRSLKSLAVAKAVAVSHATAPVIAFAEDHSFPEPGWGAALLEAHSLGYAGVAPLMKNANPASGLSWAAMFLHFGGAVDQEGPSEPDYPSASHNMSYRRDVLTEIGATLGRLMLAELFLHEELRRRGHRMRFHPTAVTRHVNMSRLGPALWHAWVGGRLYGGLRQEFGRWSLVRRIVWACGSPLIPALRLSRVVPAMRRTAVGQAALRRALPAMVLILTVHAAGEAAGYLFGVGDSDTTYTVFETRRYRHVRVGDMSLWQ
jgi:hypothetical protein